MEGKVMLWILIITCFWWNSNSYSTFKSFLSTVVDEKVGAYEANTPISGPNGYCVDVKGSNYTDGAPIILWSCDAQLLNQRWTFESDGTLRSKGKCLATNAKGTEGSYIMIHDCNTAPPNTIIWQLTDDKLIVNPPSGLALTAISGNSAKTLTLETNIYSSFQTWRASNDTKPSLVSIIGMNTLCLQESDNAVWVTKCEKGNLGQRWLLYPDGTIRPEQKRNGCLSYDTFTNKRVVVLSCGLGSSSQRWLFTQYGTILNQRVDLVMDVKGSDPSLKEIIVYSPTGKPNQRWEIITYM